MAEKFGLNGRKNEKEIWAVFKKIYARPNPPGGAGALPAPADARVVAGARTARYSRPEQLQQRQVEPQRVEHEDMRGVPRGNSRAR